jgi:circadian clock protein KaiC
MAGGPDDNALDLDMLSSPIRGDLADGTVDRVVIDSLAELVSAARETERFPAYARSLTGLIRAAGASLVITSETTTLGPTSERAGGGATFLFHNLIQLRHVELVSATGRALNIVKMRNSNHAKNLCQFEIGERGAQIGDQLEGVTGALGWNAPRAAIVIR